MNDELSGFISARIIGVYMKAGMPNSDLACGETEDFWSSIAQANYREYLTRRANGFDMKAKSLEFKFPSNLLRDSSHRKFGLQTRHPITSSENLLSAIQEALL